jgi:hypothetical protein
MTSTLAIEHLEEPMSGDAAITRARILAAAKQVFSGDP